MMGALFRQFVLREEQNAKALYAFLRANWRRMADEGHPIGVTVAEYKSKRSKEQNARYWRMLHDISESAWLNGKQYSDEAWHEYFKGKFIGMEEAPDGRLIGLSTTGLDVHEFSDFMMKVEVFSVEELGIQLTI